MRKWFGRPLWAETAGGTSHADGQIGGATDGADTLTGTPGDDSFDGLGGDDFLRGLAGDDFLNGGLGNDLLDGGGDDDIYIVDSGGDRAVEADGGGDDVVYAFDDFRLGAGSFVEYISGIDWTFVTDLRLEGNELGNLIDGNAGDNFLNGGGGTDVMNGFEGDDIYIVDDLTDLVVELFDEGNDTVYALGSYALASGMHVEYLAAIDRTFTDHINLTGNLLVNLIDGNAGHNIIDGGGGDGDVMNGFAGDDTYFVDDPTDLVVELLGEGNDIVFTVGSYTLPAGMHIEHLSASDPLLTTPLTLTGNALLNRINGNAGINFISSGGGGHGDILRGFAGDDTYIVHGESVSVVELFAEGNDTVYALDNYSLGPVSHVERLSAMDRTLTTHMFLNGNRFDNLIEGNAGNNRLDGRGGNDLLFGFEGADIFAFIHTAIGGFVAVIGDFEPGIDRIGLGFRIFPGLGSRLDPQEFTLGTSAQDADDRIIYDPATGALYFDIDGSGTERDAVQFARLDGAPALAASDFFVVI
jgi:Ca2+-binding RTX toxin-like protein